jgi:DNA replication protein DnaC
MDRHNRYGRFIIDDQNRLVLTNLKYYLAQIPGQLDLKKGILFMGTTGTGKTVLMDMMARVMQYRFSWEVVLNIFTATGITGSYYDPNSLIKWKCSNGYLGINDLGYERPYKSGQNPIKEILFDRYERKLYTFATTNLDTQQLVNFYDDEDHRLLDRLEPMFNIVVLTGQSRR